MGRARGRKNFEHVELFFQPAFVNPYGIGSFGSVTVGLVDDPLLDLHLNPALWSERPLPKHHFYINFRSQVNVRDEDEYTIHPCYDYRSDYAAERYDCWYPHYYAASTRKAVEPVVALAYLLRPFQGRSNYTLGLTYQAVFQDERYYEIPQNIYRSQLGFDYAGRAVADESNIPVIDRYRGEDEMHQQGHFLSLVNSAAILPYLDVRWRLSRVTYNRDGSFGSADLWDHSAYYAYESSRDYLNNRRQNYDHWDVLVGATLRPKEHWHIGMSLGFLEGEAIQDLSERDISHYFYGNRNKDKNWGIYNRRFSQDQQWRHDGQSHYGALHLKARLNESMTLFSYYRTTRANIKLDVSSAVADTSYSEYRSEWRDSYYEKDYVYESQSNFKLSDIRHGSGKQRDIRHQIVTTLRWQVDDKTKLDFGIQWSELTKEINSCEIVFAERFNHYHWKNNDEGQTYEDGVREDKDLKWRFRSHADMIQIPLFLRRQVSEKVELLFAINRRMTQRRMDDLTEAWYRFKEETIAGDTNIRGAVIERYTSPREVRTDIETMLLAGVVISPAKKFDIRLMAVPTYIKTYSGSELDDIQWWIDFNLFP